MLSQSIVGPVTEEVSAGRAGYPSLGMRAVVVGGGPIGMFGGMALARRGHQVVLVDRDPGPGPDGSWQRLGVMQFQHPHFYRAAVRLALLAELPDVWDAILAAGGEPRLMPGLPEVMTGLACRRSVFERVVRRAAVCEPGLDVRVGHVDRVLTDRGVVRGVLVDGATVDADVVISAAGRASHVGDELRGPVEGGPCGLAYVSRMYRARPGHPGCDLPVPSYATADGYLSLVLPQDDNTLSALICRPTTTLQLAGLRHNDAYQAAAQAVPNLAPWTDPERFEPITDVLVGGGLTNTYRYQGTEPGVPPARGLYFVGDTVCTTNPAAGRGLTLGLRQAQHLLGLLDEPDVDADDVSRGLDAWSDTHVRPWFHDHVRWDATLLRRFAGDDLDLHDRIPSDVICAAAQVDPEIAPFAGMYLGMVAGPEVLDGVEDRARALLRTGWRPKLPGPDAAELADVIAAAVPSELQDALAS